MSLALASVGAAAIVAPAAWAVDVGDTVTNPITGATETVEAILGDNVVMTDVFNVIIVNAAVGDTIVDPTATSDTAGSAPTYTVTAVNVDPFANIVSYTAEDADGNSFTFSSVTSRSGDISPYLICSPALQKVNQYILFNFCELVVVHFELFINSSLDSNPLRIVATVTGSFGK